MKPTLFFIVLVTTLLTGCNPTATDDPFNTDNSPHIRLIQRYFTAYNQADFATIEAMLDEAAVWLSIENDHVTTAYNGRDALLRVIHDYRQSTPSHSEVIRIDSLGPWVYVRERVTWSGNDGPQAQSAMSIYQIQDQRIRRIWYYPAVTSTVPDLSHPPADDIGY